METSGFGKRKFLLTQVLAAVLILVTVTGCIYYGKTSYSEMVSKVDERLSRRLQKYDLYRREYTAMAAQDQDILETSKMVDFFYTVEGGTKLHQVDFDPYHLNYLNYILDEDGMTVFEEETLDWLTDVERDSSKLALCWTDEDGDFFCMVNGRIWIYPAEYGYTYYIGSASDREINLHGLNVRSNQDRDMVSLANEIFTKEESQGWAGKYRYLITNTMDVDVLGNKYLFLTDCSDEKAGWKENIAKISVAAASLDVILIVLMFFLEREKNKKIVSEEKTKSSIGLSEDASAEKRSGLSAGIPKDVAKQLLSYVDDTERSMGPSGYLDSIRSTVEENMEKM